MMNDIVHTPVMLEETLAYLQPEPGAKIIDGTVGQGGHAEAILRATAPDGRVLGIDRDPRNLAVAKHRLARFGDRVLLIRGSFADAPEIADEHGFPAVDGILLDVGFSSAHIEDPQRGFSFKEDGPLDMRYDPDEPMTAAGIVNTWQEEELIELIRRYGEDRRAKRIARAIVRSRKERPIERTRQLVDIIAGAVGRRERIHPATRTFQALRIAVNNELGELESALPRLADMLVPGGRLVVISFHSLEDRIVKRFLKSRSDLDALAKKPVAPSEKEISENKRARSAKLRAAKKH